MKTDVSYVIQISNGGLAPEWENTPLIYDDYDLAVAAKDARKKQLPHYSYRIVKRTITEEVI